MKRTTLMALIVACVLGFAASQDAGMTLTAALANVSGAPGNVRLEILRWSTDEERDRLMAAWEGRSTAPANTKGKAAGKAAGKGAGKGGGAPAANAETVSPAMSLAKALQEATTVGYLWSQENAGYALRYAGRFANADGSQRVVLITQRRLGAVNQLWNPTSGEPNKDEFTVIELRLDAKGTGEGRASLSGKVAVDPSIKIVTLEAGQPVIFRDVKGAK